jgi:hypothetical protein
VCVCVSGKREKASCDLDSFGLIRFSRVATVRIAALFAQLWNIYRGCNRFSNLIIMGLLTLLRKLKKVRPGAFEFVVCACSIVAPLNYDFVE